MLAILLQELKEHVLSHQGHTGVCVCVCVSVHVDVCICENGLTVPPKSRRETLTHAQTRLVTHIHVFRHSFLSILWTFEVREGGRKLRD